MTSGRGAAWLARLLGVQEVPGSNPGGPTREPFQIFSLFSSLKRISSTGLAICCLAAISYAQKFSAQPETLRQGEAIEVHGLPASVKARMDGRTIPLYKQSDSQTTLGLMPVPVLAKPGAKTLEWLDGQGSVVHTETITVRNAHYPTQNVVLTPQLNSLRSSPQERKDFGEFMKAQVPVRYWSEPFQAPIPGCITSPFGVRRLHNGKPTGEFHAGLDQRGAAGSPIHAITGGEVKLAQQFALRGGTVALDHGQGLKSIYLHMSKIAAVEGQRVEAGDVIGYVGSTGRSTAPHLHWTMYANGVPINPLQWVHLVPCTSSPAAKPKPRAAAKTAH